MSISKKNKRKITVGENIFYWFFKIQNLQNILRLTVMTDEKAHSRLICKFNYKDRWLYFGDGLKPDEYYDDELLKMTDGILTPWLVRQVIDHALKKGWKPFTNGKDFIITEIEDKIDINFQADSSTEESKSKIPNLKSKIA